MPSRLRSPRAWPPRAPDRPPASAPLRCRAVADHARWIILGVTAVVVFWSSRSLSMIEFSLRQGQSGAHGFDHYAAIFSGG